MEVSTVYPSWQTNTAYKVNEMVTFGENEVGDPQLYRCIQAHTSQADWTPDIAVSLWSAIGLAPDMIPVWSQPTGSHDAYNIGDRVHYPTKDDPVYESTVDGNNASLSATDSAVGTVPTVWAVETALKAKQDKLTAGTGVSITDGTVSVANTVIYDVVS